MTTDGIDKDSVSRLSAQRLKANPTPSNVTRVDPHLAKRFQGLDEVEAYWMALRGGRSVPLRSDLNPRGIENVLDEAFIIERVAPGVSRLRVAGNHLSELVGMDVRGMPLTSLFSASARNIIRDDIEQVFTGPKTMELKLTSETGIGKPQLEAQMLLLPMRSDMGDISRALGVLVTRGRVGRSPRRFDIIGAAQMKTITAGSDAMAPSTGYKTSVANPDSKKIQDLNRHIAEKTQGSTQSLRAHLRLVHSND